MPQPFDTVFPADSLEFCPTPGFTDLFVCGTYKLCEGIAKPAVPGLATPKAYRKGQCIVFRVNDEESLAFEKAQTLDLPAIPDMKWCHGNAFDLPTLAIADSEGSISIYQWDGMLKPVHSTRIADVDTLCLSLDWNNRLNTTLPLSLAVSLSSGELSYLQADDKGNLTVMDTWSAHDYEPWITSWNIHDPNLLFSGGDDLKLKLWDIRSGFDAPVTVNKRFDAGVTTIANHLHDSTLIAVGSYDEKVRFFDTRNLLRPLKELHVGGGVWRLKWNPSPSRPDDLLIACMHDGFKVARCPRDGEPVILNELREPHESMAYGADWSFSMKLGAEKTVLAGCSFYDHRLSVWSA